MERLEVQFTGHVQGVGFRYTTYRIASRWPIVGYVENRSDGSVFLAAEGERKRLEEFLNEIEIALAPNIEKSHRRWSTALNEWTTFDIRR